MSAKSCQVPFARLHRHNYLPALVLHLPVNHVQAPAGKITQRHAVLILCLPWRCDPKEPWHAAAYGRLLSEDALTLIVWGITHVPFL